MLIGLTEDHRHCKRHTALTDSKNSLWLEQKSNGRSAAHFVLQEQWPFFFGGSSDLSGFSD
jgi:hypothetical protein